MVAVCGGSRLPHCANRVRETPEFINHTGISGAMEFHNPENELYILGTLRQMDKPARQFNLMPKVITIVNSANLTVPMCLKPPMHVGAFYIG
jgi:hypothetical protein